MSYACKPNEQPRSIQEVQDMAKVEVSYVVTFEFDTRAPLTHRGRVWGSSPASFASRAIKEAKRALRPVNWMSVVCVVDKRLFDGPVSV